MTWWAYEAMETMLVAATLLLSYSDTFALSIIVVVREGGSTQTSLDRVVPDSKVVLEQ